MSAARVKHWGIAVAGALLVSCGREPAPSPSTPTVATGTSIPTATATATSISNATSTAPAGATAPLAPPVIVRLVDVTAAGAKASVGSRCDVLYVALAKGSAVVAGQSLEKGDVLMASQFAAPGSLEMKGSGLAVIVDKLRDCPGAASVSSAGPLVTRVAHAADAKDLAWAGGSMHAHLDLEREISPDLYIGRLEGTAPVAEHDHAASWEVLCALEGAGTFTLDGVAQRVAAPQVVAVPPGRKHSWQPDPGVKLVALQIYDPPGPEQRFKSLSKP